MWPVQRVIRYQAQRPRQLQVLKSQRPVQVQVLGRRRPLSSLLAVQRRLLQHFVILRQTSYHHRRDRDELLLATSLLGFQFRQLQQLL